MVMLLFIAAMMASVYEEVYYEYATSKAYADAHEKFRNKCLGSATIDEALSCFEDAIESARETQRSEEDLYAQKQMAVWAKWMFYATSLIGVVSIGVAVAGVVLVRETLNAQRLATQEATKATRAAIEANRLSMDALIADQRPWVTVEKVEPNTDLQWGSVQGYIQVQVHMKNVGKTPALRTEVWVRLTTTKDMRELEREQIAFADEIRNDPKAFNMVIFPGQIRDFPAVGGIKTGEVKRQMASMHMPQGYFSFSILGCIDYYSDISKRTHQTGFIYRINNRLSMDSRVDDPAFNEDISREKVSLYPWPITGRTD